VQVEHPYLLFALPVSTLVPQQSLHQPICIEKAQTTAVSPIRLSTAPCYLRMKSALMRSSNSNMVLLLLSLTRCWFDRRIWANMSLYSLSKNTRQNYKNFMK